MFQIEVKSKLNVSVVLFVVIIILTIFWTLQSLWKKRKILKFAKQIEGFTFYPIIGNSHMLLGKDAFEAIQDLYKEKKLPCGFWIGHDYYYSPEDPKEIKVFLTHPSSMDKMNVFKILKVAFGNALLLAPADIWKIRRKFFSKCFTQSLLNNFVPVFYKNSNTLLEVLNNIGKRDLFNVLARNSFDNFCENIIGKNYNMQQNKDNKFIDWVDEVQHLGGKQFTNCLFYPTISLVFRKEVRRILRLIFRVKNAITKILIEKRRAYIENPVYVDNDTRFTMVDAMLHQEEKKSKIKKKEILQEVTLFMLAATDTSSNTLAFTFMFLGMHPEIQQQVYEEVISVVGCNEPIESKHLSNLKYTERVILESMRLIPVTPYTGRLVVEDIHVGNKVIPKGVNVFLSIFNIHRDEKYWTNPLRFDPDRFLPEEVAKRDPFSYLPFSKGPRNCIGKTYAMMFMKTVIANVIRNLEVKSKYKSVEELKLSTCITMRTAHPLDCIFSARNNLNK